MWVCGPDELYSSLVDKLSSPLFFITYIMLLCRHECFIGRYSTQKVHTRPHPELRELHFPYHHY